MGELFSTVDPAVIWGTAIAAVAAVWLMARARRDARPGDGAAVAEEIVLAGMSPELIAVITAAVSCARGGDAGAFRVAAISPVQGFWTPVWGHIDRGSCQTAMKAVR